MFLTHLYMRWMKANIQPRAYNNVCAYKYTISMHRHILSLHELDHQPSSLYKDTKIISNAQSKLFWMWHDKLFQQYQWPSQLITANSFRILYFELFHFLAMYHDKAIQQSIHRTTSLNWLSCKRIPSPRSNWKPRKLNPWKDVTAPEAIGRNLVLSTYNQSNVENSLEFNIIQH